MNKKNLNLLLLFSVILMGLSVNNSFGIFGQKPKETKSAGQTTTSSAQSFAEKAKQLKGAQAAKTQLKLATKAPATTEPAEKKPSLFGKLKSKVTGAAAKVQEKVITEISPEEKVKVGVVKVVTDNSGKIVNAVIEALRGIKVFPPVTQEVPQTLNNFRNAFGQKINIFANGLGQALVAALKTKGVFGSSLEITTGGAAALAEKMKSGTGEEKTGLLGKIKAAFSGIFKSKAEVAIGRMQNAISGCQNDLSDDLIRFINQFVRNRFPEVSDSDLSSFAISLRGIIYIKTSEFKDSVSNEMVNVLKQQGVLK